MRSQDPQRWNEEKPCDRLMESERPLAQKRVESGLGVRRQVAWPAAVHCGRCRGLMYRIQLRDWGGSLGQNSCDALQCIACGDIIDPVIARNRRCSGQLHVVRRKTRVGRPRVAMAL